MDRKAPRLGSLRGKLLGALILALLLALALFALTQAVGEYVIQWKYMTTEAIESRNLAHLTSLRDFVSRENVASGDLLALTQWCRQERNCKIMVYNRDTILIAEPDGGSLVSYNGMEQNNYPSADSVVNFSDGARSVGITDSSEQRLYNLSKAGAAGLAFTLFLLVMLLYNRQVTNQIRSLSRKVRQVSQGDLTLEISPKSRDEIGSLAADVNAMRLSIIDKLQREERAWQANSQLITAISHDVRTPLTTLMGYLDILDGAPDLPEAQRRQYLAICRRKAENLRELTDELFAYFLVLGTPEPEAKLEEFDGDTLLAQLLGEFSAELRQKGFAVEETLPPLGQSLRVDIHHMQRIFSNLLSNVCKYAAPEVPVELRVQQAGDLLRIRIRNGVKADAGKVESTKIGLQTCEKLAAAMGGQFRRDQKDACFTAELYLPFPAGSHFNDHEGGSPCTNTNCSSKP